MIFPFDYRKERRKNTITKSAWTISSAKADTAAVHEIVDEERGLSNLIGGCLSVLHQTGKFILKTLRRLGEQRYGYDVKLKF